MRKDKIFNHKNYFFLMVALLLAVPRNLTAAFPRPLDFFDRFSYLLPFSIFFWPTVVVVVTTLVKVWLLKRKLRLPWKIKPMETLCLGTLGETLAEFGFLILMVWPIVPLVSNLLKKIQVAPGVSMGFHLMVQVAVVTPLLLFLGTLMILVLINLFTSLEPRQLRRQYLGTGILLSLLLPLSIILIMAIRILFFK